MNDQTSIVEQADEEVLTPAVSDESLEAAASARRSAGTWATYIGNDLACC